MFGKWIWFIQRKCLSTLINVQLSLRFMINWSKPCQPLNKYTPNKPCLSVNSFNTFQFYLVNFQGKKVYITNIIKNKETLFIRNCSPVSVFWFLLDYKMIFCPKYRKQDIIFCLVAKYKFLFNDSKYLHVYLFFL